MVSFAQLRDARVAELDAAWRSWRKTVEHLRRADNHYQGAFLQGVRKARWQGADADAARIRLTAQKTRIRTAATEASAVASILNTAGRRFKAAQDKLHDEINAARMQYLTVGDDGAIHYPSSLPPRYKTWQELQTVARKIQDNFRAALKEAQDADRDISQALGRLSTSVLDSRHPDAEVKRDAALVTKLAGFDISNIPPKGIKKPSDVNAWWKSLPEEQRQLMMNAYPEKIGWMNGIPSTDRDEANRTYLDSRLEELEEKARGKTGLSEPELRDLNRLKDFSQQLSMHEGTGKDVYLLGLRPGPNDYPREGMPGIDDRSEAAKPGPDGQFIVAFGNPDTAKDTAVYVPGTEQDLDKASGSLGRMSNLYNEASKNSSGSISTISWLGYDAPDRISLDAIRDEYLKTGGPDFNDFVSGLRTSQGEAGNPHGHMTAIGHSYGSSVVGESTKHGHLMVDDIVVAGSPGMKVDHAGDLGIGSSHVWSEAAGVSDDQVPTAGAPFHGGWDLHSGPAVPDDSEFGANRMKTDSHSHSGYWDPQSVSLRNQMRVMLGQYDQVQLDQ